MARANRKVELRLDPVMRSHQRLVVDGIDLTKVVAGVEIQANGPGTGALVVTISPRPMDIDGDMDVVFKSPNEMDRYHQYAIHCHFGRKDANGDSPTAVWDGRPAGDEADVLDEVQRLNDAYPYDPHSLKEHSFFAVKIITVKERLS